MATCQRHSRYAHECGPLYITGSRLTEKPVRSDDGCMDCVVASAPRNDKKEVIEPKPDDLELKTDARLSTRPLPEFGEGIKGRGDRPRDDGLVERRGAPGDRTTAVDPDVGTAFRPVLIVQRNRLGQTTAAWIASSRSLLAMTNSIVIASPTGRRARRSMQPILQPHRLREPEGNNCAA